MTNEHYCTVDPNFFIKRQKGIATCICTCVTFINIDTFLERQIILERFLKDHDVTLKTEVMMVLKI